MTAARTTRAERMAAPLARQVVRDLAAEHSACLRPVQLRRTEIDTGHVEQVLIPCGHTLASVCPSCAERARILRAAQCREGRHLDHEPVIDPDPATEDQRGTDHRPGRDARRQGSPVQRRPRSLSWMSGSAIPEAITDSGLRGKALPARPRRHRSTRRRQDAAPLPRRTVNPRTVGQPTPRRTARLPALDIHHAHVPVVRPGRRGRSTRRPGHLRLHPRPRAALRRAIRPVHPEPAPLHRL